MSDNVNQLFGDYTPQIDHHYTTTPYAGLKSLANTVSHASGCSDNHCAKYDQSALQSAVGHSDVVVVCLGTGKITFSHCYYFQNTWTMLIIVIITFECYTVFWKTLIFLSISDFTWPLIDIIIKILETELVSYLLETWRRHLMVHLSISGDIGFCLFRFFSCFYPHAMPCSNLNIG